MCSFVLFDSLKSLCFKRERVMEERFMDVTIFLHSSVHLTLFDAKDVPMLRDIFILHRNVLSKSFYKVICIL